MLVDGCRWMGADCDLDVPEGSAGADGVSSACLMASESRWVRALRSPAAFQGSDVGGGVQGVAGGVELGSERYARLVSANVGVGLGALVEVFGLGDGVGELRLGIGESTFLLRLFDGGGRLREFVEGCLRLLVARVRSVGALFEMYRGEVRCAVRNFVRHVMFGHLA